MHPALVWRLLERTHGIGTKGRGKCLPTCCNPSTNKGLLHTLLYSVSNPLSESDGSPLTIYGSLIGSWSSTVSTVSGGKTSSTYNLGSSNTN